MELNNLKIFYWVEKKVVDEILNNSQKEKFSPWETIIVEWEESNWKWYIIESWEVEVFIKWNIVAKLW
jgi:heat shock protein HspQ